MYKETLWYDIYSGRKINWDIFLKYFHTNGSDDTWYIYYIERGGEPWFELHAHIEGDTLKYCSPFKADVYGGHGRPTVVEHGITSTEKKYAVSVFEECFVYQYVEDFDLVINNAIFSKVQYEGYEIHKQGTDHVVFLSPDNKKVKLQHKLLQKALEYSHRDLSIVRESSRAQLFASCFGFKNYEPLFAILKSIDVVKYPEYDDLNRKYRYEKMRQAISDNPLGPYEKKGTIIDNCYCDPCSWNNHGSIEEYKGQWYVFYHRSSQNMRYSRRACVEKIYFNEDGTINEVEMTSQGASEPIDAFSKKMPL